MMKIVVTILVYSIVAILTMDMVLIFVNIKQNWYCLTKTGAGFLDFQSGSGFTGIKKKTGIPVAL